MSDKVSEYKKEIKELKARIRSLEYLLDELPDMLFIKDENLRYIEVNLACARYMAGDNAEPRDLIGKTDYEYYSREDADKFRDDEEAVLDTGKAMINHDEPRTRKDGSESWILTSRYPVRDSKGKVVGLFGVFHDVSDFKEAQTNAAVASRLEATATLAGGIAHKFNNLMAVVLGHISMMPGDKTPSINAIESAATEAGNLAHQMLAFARGGKIMTSPVDINRTIREMVVFEKEKIKDSIDLKLDLANDCEAVQADPRQIDMVISALIRNAVEAIDEKGSIKITTIPLNREGNHDPAYVTIIVEDDGCGMDEKMQMKIFEPFFTTKFQGRGLGMAAAYGIVHNHSGLISATSKQGEGTKITVCLPAREGKESPLIAGIPDVADSTGTETVMIVDDEPSIRAVFSKMLTNKGYKTIVASSGYEAIDALRANPDIQLVVLDLEMSGMDGKQTYGSLKKVNSNVKILVCSGFNLSEEINELVSKYDDEYAQKPLNLDGLASRVRVLLDKKSS